MSVDETVMVTPADVAARDKVTKQAVTKLVRQLVEKHGLPVERDGRERVVRFSLAHYDHYRGEFASSEKVAASRSSSPSSPPQNSGTSRDEALRQEAWLKVGRERLRQQEDAGQLIRADRTRDALIVCGREIQNIIARLQNKADDMAMAVSREGAHGLRVMLRQVSFDLNTEIANKLAAIVDTAALHDEPIEDDEL